MALPLLASAVTSFQRIQDFLNAEERQDNRSTHEGTTRSSAHNSTAELSPRGPYELQRFETNNTNLDENIIVSIEGKFSWTEESEPVLDLEQWNIRRKAFTLVLGPVGCGKSTLLKAILGELSAFKGMIRTNHCGAAYCSQSAWIPNETVRHIITGGSELDALWYDTVLKACALNDDLTQWPLGDQTIAGTGGISMSGGQKHRLAIARALYSRRELVIFDDVFSGLDTSTKDLVFSNLFGDNGLLKEGNLTIVLASSEANHSTYAHDVLLLTENGHIKQQGSVRSLDQSLQFSSPSHDKRSDTPQATGVPSQVNNSLTDHQIKLDATRQLGDSRMYMFYAKGAGWVSLVVFCVAMLVEAFCDSFPNIWLKWWAEANEISPNQHLGKWLGVYVSLGIGSVTAMIIGIWQLFIVLINRSGVYFHEALLETTSHADMTFHTTVDSGVTVNRFSQDLALIDMELPAATLGLAITVSFGIAQFIMIAISSKYIAALFPLICFAFYTIQHFYLRTSRQMRLLEIEYKAPLLTNMIETLDGLATIRAFGWESVFSQKNMNRLNDSQRPTYLLTCLQRWLVFVVDMMIAVIAIILIVLVTTLREQIGPGYSGIALMNTLALSSTVKACLTSWVMLEIALGAVARVRSFTLNVKPEGDGDIGDKKTVEELKDWPGDGTIELIDVTASYSPSSPILQNITISVKSGERVAICGRTGSGKSSLLHLLLRLLSPTKGEILISSAPLSSIPHSSIRHNLLAFPQEPYIFASSLRDNLDPSSLYTDAELQTVLTSIGMWNKVIARGGLGVQIDDKFWSLGEAALLCFARGMLRKKGRSHGVLILDEITSSLDKESSERVMQVLEDWFQGWTILAVAHKIEEVMGFDRVVVLDKGRVMEVGEPTVLREVEGGMFRRLCEGAVGVGLVER